MQYRKFDPTALHTALDAERQTRGLSWVEVVGEINRPFHGTGSLPISLAPSMSAARTVSAPRT